MRTGGKGGTHQWKGDSPGSARRPGRGGTGAIRPDDVTTHRQRPAPASWPEPQAQPVDAIGPLLRSGARLWQDPGPGHEASSGWGGHSLDGPRPGDPGRARVSPQRNLAPPPVCGETGYAGCARLIPGVPRERLPKDHTTVRARRQGIGPWRPAPACTQAAGLFDFHRTR